MRTDTKLGGYNVAPLEWTDTFSFGCLLHLQTMFVRACEEYHWTSGVQYALKPCDDVCGDERVEVSDVRAFREISASRNRDARLVRLTGIGVKYGRGDIERFVCALRRVVPSDEGHNGLDCVPLERAG